jgi:amidophosphoribosyltransferase
MSLPESEARTGELSFPVFDGPREACGVFAVYAPGEDVARLTFFGLFQLQHRGQESAGIAVSNGERISLHKNMGLVNQVFDEPGLARLTGDFAIGHTRYSTTGSSSLVNAQPILAPLPAGAGHIALAHNGNLLNVLDLRSSLRSAGLPLESTSDSELIAKLITLEANAGPDLEAAIARAAAKIRGAYSVVMLTETQLFALRDPHGFHPLCLGQLNGDNYVIASESCALNVVNARYLREVEPGELVVIDRLGLRSATVARADRKAFCIFEFIYFARPDSQLFGRSVYSVRRRMGQQLAQEHPVQADLVIPVPYTGGPAAIGFAEAARIPFGEGLIKSRYIHRTFIKPDQRQRDLGVRLALTPLREELAGKRVAVVEDSIVRGTTKRKVVRLLQEAGAREVHLRISSPPYRSPCVYGIDTADRQELLAAKVKDVDEIRQFLGADSLGYLSLRGLFKAVNLPRDKFCAACFTGRYPLPVPPELQVSKFALEDEPE